MKKLLFGAALLSICSASFALVWAEVGDAPELIPGQATGPPIGPLDAITGSIRSDSDRDLYLIEVVDFGSFRANTDNGLGTLSDTQLFLWDISRNGVTHSDDAVGGSNLRSTLTGQFLTHNGLYYIGISAYNGDPSSPAGLIWNNSPFRSERPPDGPGAPGPLTSWGGTGFGTGTYQIDFRGTNTAVPEPVSLLALGAGLALLAARRRKK